MSDERQYVTVTIQIGNGDNKLTQQEWSEFFKRSDQCVREHAHHVHFAGTSAGDAPWQNACWVIECEGGERLDGLRQALIPIRQRFHQDAVALTIGTTRFI